MAAAELPILLLHQLLHALCAYMQLSLILLLVGMGLEHQLALQLLERLQMLLIRYDLLVQLPAGYQVVAPVVRGVLRGV